MKDKPPAKPLSTETIEAINPFDKDKADIGENTGLRVTCGATGIKTFFYRYSSPITGNLIQLRIGHFPQISLASARLEVQKLKKIRQQGRCPKTENRKEKQRLLEESQKQQASVFTVECLVELYLTERIEDRKSPDGKIIPGARKKRKGKWKYAVH